MAENKNVRPPMGGRRGGRVVEKPKDFKGTTKKLLKNYYQKLIQKKWLKKSEQNLQAL